MRLAVFAFLAAFLAACGSVPRPAVEAGAPRLVLVISIDGLPRRQLEGAHDALAQGGLRRFLDQGADFTQAHHGHAYTVTCAGHAAMLTGAHPARTGMIGNEWRDLDTGAWTYCLSDEAHAYIGHRTGRLEGTSPRKLRAETLGDVLRARHPEARVIAVSGKDRGAIPLAGHRGTAYVYRAASGMFASTTYYMREHPAWAKGWNARRKPAPVAGLDAATLDFARAALDAEGLGADDVPDVLAISLSAQDTVNHAYGAESPRTDRELESFFAHLDVKVGKGRYIAALTSDHGFTPAPELSADRGWGGGRVPSRRLVNAATEAISQRWGPGAWVLGISAGTLALNRGLAAERGVALDEMADVARDALLALEPVAAAFTRRELLAGSRAGEPHFEAMRRSFHAEVSGDVQVALKPFWILSAGTSGTTHGAPHAHDTHVPLALFGPPWIRAGRVETRVLVVDLAATLARFLGIPPPSASEGTPLPLP
jgi:hypothetical protein